MTELVNISNLSKTFSPMARPALKHINSSIPKGQMVGLAGPDGAGKTTLIRLIAGLLLPTTGSITVAGYDTITEASSIHRLIGYMPQKFGLYEDLSVKQNLSLYAVLRGITPEEQPAVFAKLLGFTGLAPFTGRLAGDLSGGMKQKLGLACALISKPSLLLLDEPSVGVDPISRRELWKMVRDLLDEGISVLWSTAYLDEAEKCDTVLLLNEGEMLYHGCPASASKRVQGKVFKISNITGSPRQMLFKVLNQPNVIDGVIQGADIRFVVKEIKNPPIDIEKLEQNQALQITPVPPRFEDAFIDILGGKFAGFSELANATPMIAATSQNVIVAEGLTKKFGSFIAVEDVSFKINRGEIFGLLGPNGAGKSTTFKMMCGLLRPTHGKASVGGLDLQIAPGAARARIGYMAQKFSLYGDLSVKQNLDFFSGIYSLMGKEQKDAIDLMIEIFNLNSYSNTTAESLPFGFKQRLSLACATMHHPNVLFLDEPTSGVDPITRREFWNHINGLVEKGVTVMVTTHFMDEAEYCDRIGLVYRGRLIRMGTPDELKALAKTPDNPGPTLEDAFIGLIEAYDAEHPL